MAALLLYKHGLSDEYQMVNIFYLDNIGLVIFLVLAATVLTLILTLVKENLTQQMVSFRKLLWKERETLKFQLIVFGLKDGLT